MNNRRRWSGLMLATAALLLSGCRAAGFALVNAGAPNVQRTADLPYAQGTRGAMDVYTPRAASTTALPLIVFWYGGSWQSGNRSDYRFVGAALAAGGAVVAVPDYRLYPEARFPEFLQDAARAVAAAQAQAARWNADPRRIVLGGHSAGAYIAAMLALQPQYLREAGVDPASIAGFFGLSGPYEIEPDSGVLREIFNARATRQQFQPIAHVSAAAPPALLVHGGDDDIVYASQTVNLANALRARGVAVDLRIVPGRSHYDTAIALSRVGGFRVPGLREAISDFAASVPARVNR